MEQFNRPRKQNVGPIIATTEEDYASLSDLALDINVS
jgi:hypothetical protein